MSSSPVARVAPGGPELSHAIARLFPPGVAAAELRGTFARATLLPDEAMLATGFSGKRAADFAAGRACARRALAEFGYARYPLGRNADRRPDWPAAVVGSISHTSGFCGAVVAPAARFDSIGFDAESAREIDPDLWPALFTSLEISWLAALPAAARAASSLVVFSAKEAYYKCHFGLSPGWLDFIDVAVTFAAPPARAGTFEVRPARGNAAAVARSGRYALVGNTVLTGVADVRLDRRALHDD